MIKRYNNELSQGIRTELEHKNTIKKIQQGNINIRTAAKLIALDHLKEDPKYYKKLCKLEKKC